MRLKITCPKCKESSHVDVTLPPQSKGGKARAAQLTTELRREYAKKGIARKRKEAEDGKA